MQRPQSIVVSSTSSITSSSSVIVFNVPLRNEKGNSRDVTYHLTEGSPAILVLWARWLSAKATKFARFGLLRMVRDLLHISGHIKNTWHGSLGSRARFLSRMLGCRGGVMAAVTVRRHADVPKMVMIKSSCFPAGSPWTRAFGRSPLGSSDGRVAGPRSSRGG